MTAVWSSVVRYAECDQQGIVFNAHYLTYADEACTAWFVSVGTPYGSLLARELDMRVRASTLQWRAPLRPGDTVSVAVPGVEVGRTSWTMTLEISGPDGECCTVRTTYVLVGADGRPAPVPADLRAAWTRAL